MTLIGLAYIFVKLMKYVKRHDSIRFVSGGILLQLPVVEYPLITGTVASDVPLIIRSFLRKP